MHFFLFDPQVLTTDNTQFEGLFRVFSSKLEITLEQAHQILDPSDPSRISPETVRETVIFPLNKVIAVTAVDVDLEYAAKQGTPKVIQMKLAGLVSILFWPRLAGKAKRWFDSSSSSFWRHVTFLSFCRTDVNF